VVTFVKDKNYLTEKGLNLIIITGSKKRKIKVRGNGCGAFVSNSLMLLGLIPIFTPCRWMAN